MTTNAHLPMVNHELNRGDLFASLSGTRSFSTSFASKIFLSGILALLVALPTASASAATFTTPVGATTSGGAVNAEVDFTVTDNTVSFTVTDLQDNPKDVAQAISAIFFTVDPAETSGSLASSSGIERSISSHLYTDSTSTVPTGWVLSNSGAAFEIDDLGGAGPAHLIIGGPAGDNKYDAANGSIDGNGPHNPFLAESADFTVTITGVTADTTISDVAFQFGTENGKDIVVGGPNGPSGIPTPVPVPEPASLLMLTIGLAALGGFQFLRRRLAA